MAGRTTQRSPLLPLESKLRRGAGSASSYPALRWGLADTVPCGFRLIHSTNPPTSGWAFRASSVLYSRSSSLLLRTVCICRWQGEQRSTVLWISCRSKVFLFRLFLWRVLGTKWCRVSLCTVRSQRPHVPLLPSPLVLFTPLF